VLLLANINQQVTASQYSHLVLSLLYTFGEQFVSTLQERPDFVCILRMIPDVSQKALGLSLSQDSRCGISLLIHQFAH
jgi:hypothetical protein